MKKLLLSIIFIISMPLSIFPRYEPMGRYDYSDNPYILPPLGFSGIAFLIAIILFSLGWYISYISEKRNGEGSILGGRLIMWGIIFAIPGLFWLQLVFASIYIFIICCILLFAVIKILRNSLKGK